MQRVLVVGITGAGKTTAAHLIATAIRAPFYEMDVLAFGPKWSTPPDFVETVADIVSRPTWVFDSYGYDQVRDLMWARADTVVWLDYPIRVVLGRVVRRSLRRSITRAEVFGGNRETWRGWFSVDHPVWWALKTFGARRAHLADRTHAPDAAHIRVIRLTNPAEFDRWFARTDFGPADGA